MSLCSAASNLNLNRISRNPSRAHLVPDVKMLLSNFGTYSYSHMGRLGHPYSSKIIETCSAKKIVKGYCDQSTNWELSSNATVTVGHSAQLFFRQLRCLPLRELLCTSVSLAPACGVQTVYSTISLFCHFECLWNQTPKSFWMFMFQRIRIIGVHSSNTTRLLGLKDCLTLPIDMPRSISSVCLLPLLQKFDFLIGEMYRLWEWHYLCCWSEEAWLRNFRLTKIAE